MVGNDGGETGERERRSRDAGGDAGETKDRGMTRGGRAGRERGWLGRRPRSGIADEGAGRVRNAVTRFTVRVTY